MTSTGGPPEGERSEPVDLDKGAAVPFDPYRFGKPDVPPPPEYAPPGYVPDAYLPDAPPEDTFDPYRFGKPDVPPSRSANSPVPPPGYWPTGYGSPPHGGHFPNPNQQPYVQHPYNQQPYGMPPPYGPYPGGRQNNGKAIAGMVLGIASILLCWLSFFTIVVIVPAIVFSLLGLSDSKTRGSGRGQAIAGLVCVAIGIVLTVLISILEFHLIHSCSGIQSGTTAYNNCVRNQI